jgi:hypothetical protein
MAHPVILSEDTAALRLTGFYERFQITNDCVMRHLQSFFVSFTLSETTWKRRDRDDKATFLGGFQADYVMETFQALPSPTSLSAIFKYF